MNEIVCVDLMDEGTPTWLAVPATRLSGDVSELGSPIDYDPEDYTLEFPPGSKVICERRPLHDGSMCWFAVAVVR
jgi:hypothetical protein